MTQRTSGLYKLTQITWFYSLFQSLVGGERTRQVLIDELIRPQPGIRILDLGCGHASILSGLGDVEYVGIDLNQSHIDRARLENGDRGRFHAGDFASLQDECGASFDLVLCIGLLHHLEDVRCAELLQLARTYLKPDGRFFAIDPAFETGQNWIAYGLAKLDSGQCVRTAKGYSALLEDAFPATKVILRRDLMRVPYTHCISHAFMASESALPTLPESAPH